MAKTPDEPLTLTVHSLPTPDRGDAERAAATRAGRWKMLAILLVFLLAFVVQWGVGSILNQWVPEAGAYPKVAYQYALGVILALQIPGLLLWLTFKPWVRSQAAG